MTNSGSVEEPVAAQVTGLRIVIDVLEPGRLVDRYARYFVQESCGQVSNRQVLNFGGIYYTSVR